MNEPLDRSLPSSEGAERIILGTVLIDNEIMQQVAEALEAGDFYSPLHRRVFAAMLALHATQRNINPIAIGEELKKDGPIDAIGGVPTITNLTFGLPYLSDLSEYIETVRKKSALRKLIRTMGRLTHNAMSESEDVEDVFADAQTQINEICLEVESGRADGHFVSLERVIDNDVLQALDNLRHGRTSKIPTGFRQIDLSIGGLTLSDVLLVAADTGAGKSAFALQMAYQIAAQGIPTAFLAGEMTNAENVLRLLSQVSGVTNLNWLQHISDHEYQLLLDWATAIKNAPIYFEHRISDMQTLRTHLRSIVRRHKVKVLVIDYIQLFKMEKLDRRKRNERIAEASQEVKRLANEMGIAIIEVAQYNREGAKSGNAGLHDLEGSGQLEKDASLIFLLDLSDGEFEDGERRKYREAKLRIVKGRNVGKGECVGRFYGRSVQFDFS